MPPEAGFADFCLVNGAGTLTMPSSCEDLILVVTLRKSGGYRLRAFAGFPLDLTTATPLEGFEDADFPLHEWLQGEHPMIEALKPLLVERSRVRFCYDPSEPYLNLLPLEDVFARRFGVPLSRHLLTKAGALATPYAEDVSVSGKLKVLLIYANPEPKRFPAGGRDPIYLPYLKEHFRVLVQALSGLVRQQLIVFESLDNEDGRLTTQHIIEQLKTFNPHILVYVGHGYQNPYGNGLYWGDRDEEQLPFGLLRATLAEMEQKQGDDEKPLLRLLVLIACHSAKAGPQLQVPTFSEDEGVQEVQVPAVVGMDREFPAAAVAAFSAPFFGAVSERRSVEEAFIEALRALRESSDSVLKYANARPRFYLTASHSHLFPPPEDCARGLYLEKVKGEYGQVRFSNRVTTVPLKDLYVDRVVVERKEDTQQRQQRTPAPPVSERLAQLERHAIEPPEQVVELWKALQDPHHHRLLVIAEARTGKTMLCQHVLMNCDQQTRGFPIFVRFSDFSREPLSLREFLQENYAKSLELNKLTVLTGIGELTKEVPFGEWLYLRWEAGNALLIVDGLDEEFNEERRAAALSRIPLTADKQKQPRVLFTSRPFGTMLVKDAYVLHLKEFEKDHQLRRCARNCERILARLEGRDADEQRVTRFRKELDENRQRKDLARRPGHLVEMYVQFCDTGTTSLFEDTLTDWVATDQELAEVETARDFLWRVRSALNLMSGKPQDRLTFEYQEKIAPSLGFQDTKGLKAVEQLMQTCHLHAVTLTRFARKMAERCFSRRRRITPWTIWRIVTQ